MRAWLLAALFLSPLILKAAEPYQLKAGEFPPLHSEQRVSGELVEADFIHRAGQFQMEGTGELVDFTLTPYAIVRYRNAEADLRDIPLGTRCEFYLYAGNKVAGMAAEPGADAAATEEQRKKHVAFLKARGLAAWIDRVDGMKLTLTFFGDPAGMKALFKDEGIEPEKWMKEKRRIAIAVANEELRTYNPPVDNKRGAVLEMQSAPVDNCGCSGERWVLEPDLLLEGFRKGRVVRVFVHPAWPIEDMPFGEGLYSERFGFEPGGPEANQFPFRTDFGNAHLPWFQLQPGELPPLRSEHRVSGELVNVDLAKRAGQFRTDRTGEVVDFTLLPFGTVQALNAEADLSDLAPGTRCQFFLHPDEKGAFTKASVITDEFTRLADEKLTYRVEAVQPDKLFVAWKLPEFENDRNRMEQPPDLGHGELSTDATTRVWKGDQPAKLSDLAVGDELLVNITGRTATSRGRCTDIWVGAATHKAAAAQQLTKHSAFLQEHGLPAWIERVEGKKLVLTLLNGPRRDEFKKFFDDNFKQGQEIKFAPADDTLLPVAPVQTARFTDNKNIPLVTHGCSGTRITIEPDAPLEGARAGGIVRLFAPGWPVAAAAKD